MQSDEGWPPNTPTDHCQPQAREQVQRLEQSQRQAQQQRLQPAQTQREEIHQDRGMRLSL
jgi:hypothetical protein